LDGHSWASLECYTEDGLDSGAWTPEGGHEATANEWTVRVDEVLPLDISSQHGTLQSVINSVTTTL